MAETKVVVRALPPKFTTDEVIKLVPLTVIVKVESPIFLDVGEIEVVVGTGLLRVKVLDVPVSVPPVLVAVIVRSVPAPESVTDSVRTPLTKDPEVVGDIDVAFVERTTVPVNDVKVLSFTSFAVIVILKGVPAVCGEVIVEIVK